jgi:hypothetical protein
MADYWGDGSSLVDCVEGDPCRYIRIAPGEYVCTLAGYILQGVLAGLWHVHFLPLSASDQPLLTIVRHDRVTEIVTVIVDMYMCHSGEVLVRPFFSVCPSIV